MPEVSIVVPSYNNDRFINEAIDSILAQTHRDFELIIADHSSTDRTWELLQPYADDPRVTLLQTPAGGGAPANWDAVTNKASGEFIKLVCGDDLIYPTCLEKQLAAIKEHDAVVVASRRDILDAEGRVLIHGRGLGGLDQPCEGTDAIRATVRAGSNIFGEPGCVLARREVLADVGGWDARDPYVIDLQTYCRMMMHGRFAPVHESLAAFRLSATQWTARLAHQQSSQVVSFHHRIAADFPGVLSPADLRLGDTRARVMAFVRRAAHLWLAATHQDR